MYQRILSTLRRSSAPHWWMLMAAGCVLLWLGAAQSLLAGGVPFPTATPEVAFPTPIPGVPPQSAPPLTNAPVYELSATLTNDDNTYAVATGDLNGDGALDLVMGNSGSPDVFYLNDGQGGFDAGTPFGAGLNTYAVAVADMNGDGNLDIITSGDQNVIYFNDGHAHFVSQSTFGDQIGVWLAVGDVDGDSDFDLLTGGQIWRNDGHGQLTATATIPGENQQLVDFDNDGDLDLVAHRYTTGSLHTFVVFYTNDGTGTFTPRDTITLSSLDSVPSVAALGDLDGDGHLDLVLATTPIYADTLEHAKLFLYRKDGPSNSLPSSTPQVLNEFAGAGFIQLADIDADGDLDIITNGLLYLNQGLDQAGLFQFTRVPWGPPTGVTGLGVLADLNGDGIDEIVLGTGHFDAIYASHSRPAFGPCRQLTSQPTESGLVGIDLAGDGDLDLLYQAYDSRSLLAAHNDGAGNFQENIATGVTFNSAVSFQPFFATADLNADGLADLIVAYVDQPAQIYLQTQDGSFGLRTRLDAASIGATSLATGDLDGDGDIDLVSAMPRNGPDNPGQTQIYLNPGDGGFDPALPLGGKGGVELARVISSGTSNTGSLTLADLDNDGNLDIVASNTYYTSDPSVIYWNRGNWATPDATHFTVDPFLGATGESEQVVAGDFNGDGFTDLVVVGWQKTPRSFLNRGDRTFAQQWLATADEVVINLLALDLDLDGDLDLLTIPDGSALINDGHGVFVEHWAFPALPQIGVPTVGLQAHFLGDLNGDGLADAIGDVQYSAAISAPPCLALQTHQAVYPKIKLLPLDKTVLDGPYASPQIFAAGAITFTYTLFEPHGQPSQCARLLLAGWWRQVVHRDGYSGDCPERPGDPGR